GRSRNLRAIAWPQHQRHLGRRDAGDRGHPARVGAPIDTSARQETAMIDPDRFAIGRREFLALAALPLAQLFDGHSIDAGRGSVVGTDGRPLERIDLERAWNGPLCTTRVTNRS